MQETGVIKYDQATKMLAACVSVDQVKNIRDKARAMQIYAQQAMNVKQENDATRIRIMAERKCGQFLSEMVMAVGSPGNQHTGKLDPSTDSSGPNPLNIYKISHYQSSRWQKLAAIPEEDFYAALGSRNRKPSTGAIIRGYFPDELPDPEEEITVRMNGESGALDQHALGLWHMVDEIRATEMLKRDPTEIIPLMSTNMHEDYKAWLPPLIQWLQDLMTAATKWEKDNV